MDITSAKQSDDVSDGIKRVSRVKNSTVTRIAIAAIRIYQATISPDHGILKNVSRIGRCRFYPSCSEYALQAIRQYGLLPGGVASAKRILRCGPWSDGGYDPVYENQNANIKN